MQNEDRLFFAAPDSGGGSSGSDNSQPSRWLGSGSGYYPPAPQPSASNSNSGSRSESGSGSPLPFPSGSASGSSSGCNMTVKVTVLRILTDHLGMNYWRYHYDAYADVKDGTAPFIFAWSVPGQVESGAGTDHIQFYIDGPIEFDVNAGWGTASVTVTDARGCTASGASSVVAHGSGGTIGSHSGSGELPQSNSGSASASGSDSGIPHLPSGSASGSWSGSSSSSASSSGSGTTPPIDSGFPTGGGTGGKSRQDCSLIQCVL